MEHLTQGSHVLIITFNAHGDLGFDIPGFGEHFLIRQGYDLLCFKTLSNSWYQTLKSEDIAIIGQNICSHYQKVIGYSISMGAYALLYFSNELLLDRAIAFCPQYSIQETIVPYETRWRHEASIIEFQHNWQNKISNTQVMFIYDPYADHDQAHIEQFLPHFPNHALITLKFLGHPALGGLLESGQLKTLISGLLNDEPIDWRTIRRCIRAESINVYMVELLIHCTQINLKRSVQLYYYFKQFHQGRLAEFDNAILAITARLIDNKKYLPAYLFIIAHSYFSSAEELLNTSFISFQKHNFIKKLLPQRFQALTTTITYGFRDYLAMESDIKIENAYRHRQRIYSNGSAGTFTFGPYVYLPASIFKVCIEAEVINFPENQPVILKVTTNGGKNLIKQVEIKPLSKGQKFWEIDDVHLLQEAENIEVVIILPTGAEIILDRISLILEKLLLKNTQ